MNSRNSRKSWMWKRSITFAALFAGALFLQPAFAFAESEARITAFSSHIEIRQDGSAVVQEEIVFDFGATPLHGIYREIPLILPASDLYGETHAELSSISVTDGRGVPRQASYDQGGNMVTLKIGDYDKLVSGSQLYVVRYTLWGAFTPTLLRDRFFWDITGHEWKVPIDRVRADIVLPAPVDPASLSFSCVSGDRESTAPCTASGVQTFATSGKATMIRFEEGQLGRFQGLMVKVELPKGIVLYAPEKPKAPTEAPRSSSIVKWWQRPFIDIALAFPFFVFAGLYSFFLSQKGKSVSERARRSLWETYLVAGLSLVGFSFFAPLWNLGICLSGLVIFCFAFVYRRES